MRSIAPRHTQSNAVAHFMQALSSETRLRFFDPTSTIKIKIKRSQRAAAPTGICAGLGSEGRAVKFQTQKTPVFRPGSLLSIPNQPRVAFGVSRRSVVLETDMAQRTGLEPATPGVTGRYSNRLNYRCVSL